MLNQTQIRIPFQLIFVAATIITVAGTSGCRTVGPGAATGGAFGTLAGGLTGAAIGAKDGKSSEGALIGALTGGTLGSIAGNAVDRSVERDRLDYQQFQDQQRGNAINVEQVIRMTQSGLGSDVIARQIQNQGIARRLSIDDLIYLKNQGVDDVVIQAVQSAPIAGDVQPIRRVAAPVIYETYVPGPYHHYDGYYHGGRHHRRGCGPRAGVSVRF